MVARLKRLALLGIVFLAIAIPVGGGATFVAMEVTTKPEFCKTCHNMKPYYDSWASSSHKNVQCVDCHYEPGLLETFEGKFKALSQLAKYVTATEGTKPWAEVSDYSCMRSGCHSTRLLEGELQFGPIKFDHRQHLIRMRRGKRLRCTSCHGQIVQGNHLTVTTTTCILCHFKKSEESKPIDDCGICHGAPKEEIELGGGFIFRHSEYLGRGVTCQACHGDVTRGTGEVPRQRCGTCHNTQAHLDRYEDVDFVHENHITNHSVDCLECHDEIRHGLPPREQHFQGDCSNCHTGAHAAVSNLYRGTGGLGIADNPAVMFEARVTCNGCHRAPFEGAPTPPAGVTYRADPLACLDCHGPGYEGMAEHWQAEVRRDAGKVGEALDELKGMLAEEWEDGDVEAARKSYEAASHNYGLVLLDRSDGVHNLPYSRDLLRRAVLDIGQGLQHLDPEESAPRIAIGPRADSKQGCTQLCHSGIEEAPVTQAFGLPFKHEAHFLKARLDCAECHDAEPHGTTRASRASCVACHHEQEERCGSCHTEIAALRRIDDGDPMQQLDCLSCHESVAEGHSAAAVQQACAECHEGEAIDYAAWMESGAAALRELEELVAGAPAEIAAEFRAEIETLRRAGPHHNIAHVRATAQKLRARLGR